MEDIREALANLGKRKLRSFLTVCGVAVGIFAFILMGAMAEKFHSLSAHFQKIFKNRIFVCEKLSFWAGGGILSEFKVEKVRAVSGVGEAVPTLISRFREEQMIVLGLPEVIVGIPPEKVRLVTDNPPLLSGRWIESGDPEAITVGFDIADEFYLKPGDSFVIREKHFTVSGIIEKTGGLEDRQIFMSLASAQEILSREGLITNIIVIPGEGVNLEELAGRIKDKFPALEVITPDRIENQLKSSLATWDAITFGAAMIALFAGAFSIIIAMVVAVQERFPEIGLKKAIGASNYQIIREFMAEALVVSLAGWGIGLIFSLGFSRLCYLWLRARGSSLFLVTPELLVVSCILAVVLGIGSGFFSSLQAVKVEPVKALRR